MQSKLEPRARVGLKGGEIQGLWLLGGVPTFRKQRGLGRGLTADLEGCLQLQKNGLAQENLPGFEAQTTDLVLCQLYILSRPRALHWEWNEAAGPSGKKRVGDMGGPIGTSGGAPGPPGPRLAQGQLLLLSLLGPPPQASRDETPSYPQDTREGTAVRGGLPKPQNTGPLAWGGLGFSDFSLTPRALANPCAPRPALARGATPDLPGAPRLGRGGTCGHGTSRPVPAQSKLALGGASPPARHFRAGQGTRARPAPTSPAPANLPAGAR